MYYIIYKFQNMRCLLVDEGLEVLLVPYAPRQFSFQGRILFRRLT